jgi:hypothetical protein
MNSPIPQDNAKEVAKIMTSRASVRLTFSRRKKEKKTKMTIDIAVGTA